MFVNQGLKSVMIPGEKGLIEGKYFVSGLNDVFGKSIALVLHPNSISGGTMNNKVVKSMFDSFKKLGFDVLRINFRGVGRSQGNYDNGVGEINDALSAMDWLLDKYRDDKISNAWVAGFGFGSLVCMQTVMRRPTINGFVSVSPPSESMSLNMLTPCPNGIILAGENDHTISQSFISDLSSSLSCQQGSSISCKYLANTDHYLVDGLDDLQDEVYSYVKDNMQDLCAYHGIRKKQKRRTISA